MTVTLSGTVTDIFTQSGVEDVRVTEKQTGRSTLTNASGAWSLTTTNAGDHTMAYTYGNQTLGGQDVTAGSESITLTRTVNISGMPLSGAGAPSQFASLEANLARAVGSDGAQVILEAISLAKAATAELAGWRFFLNQAAGQARNNDFRGQNRFTGLTFSGSNNGAVPNGLSTVVAFEGGLPCLHQTVLVLTDCLVTLSDNLGVTAYGGTKLYTLPTGNILFLGAVAAVAVTKSSAGVNSTFRSTMSLGTATADNTATLTGTEANLIPSTSNAQAVSGATNANGKSTSTEAGKILDSTTTTTAAAGLGVFLNFLVNQADETVGITPCNLILNGFVAVSWMSLGDY